MRPMRWFSRCRRRRLIPHSVSLRSQPSHEKEYDEDDQDDTDNTDASVTIAVAVATEAATEAPEQEDDKDDDKYESNRHDLSPVTTPNQTFVASSHSDCEAPVWHFPDDALSRVVPVANLIRLARGSESAESSAR
jgi:hypothetical protein